MAEYNKTNWQSGMPITSALMNHIEDGIADASGSINTMNTTLTNLSSTVGQHTTTIQGFDDRITAAVNTANEAKGIANTLDQNAANGNNAYNEVISARQYRNQTTGLITNYTDLGTRLDTMTRVSEGLDTDKAEQTDLLSTQAQADRNSSNIGLIQTQINNAAGSYMNEETGQQTQRTLKQKIDSLDYELSTHAQTMTDIQNDLDAISGAYATPAERVDAIVDDITDIQNELDGARINDGTLDDRLDAIDGGSTPSRTLPNLITEVNNSHMGTYDSLNARLNRIDGGAIKSTNTARDIVDLTSEVNDAHRTTDDTLSARFSAIDTSLSGLGTADTGLSNRIGALETEVGNAHRTGLVDDQDQPITDTLANRFNDLEDELNTPTTGLKARMTTTEGDIDALESALNTAETGVLARLTSAEGRLNDIDTPETGALVLLDGRVEALETTVDTATIGLSDRMTAAEAAISHAAEGNDPGGLTERMTAAESSLAGKANSSDMTSALAAKADATDVNDLDTRLDAIDGGDTLTGNTLVSRVTALETAPKSATIVVEADHVSYDTQTGNPTIYTDSNKTTPVAPSTDVDYLLGKDDKYYYWKYIKTGSNPDTFAWALISGGGGEGTGNSSGVVLTNEEYSELSEKVENTDYFVEQSDGYHHYRWIPTEVEGELAQIEIGNWATIDKNKIKRYNIYTVNGTKQTDSGEEEVVYLNLYQYDYNEDSNAIDTDRPYFAQVELPRGGGGSASTATNVLTRIGNQTIQTIVGSQVVLRVFYSSYDGAEANDGNYTLKAGGVTIDSGIMHSGAADEVVSGWKENTEGYYEFDVSNYCRVGTTSFSLNVAVNNVNLGKSWTADIKDLRIETTAPDTLLISSNESYSFPYVPFGALTKTLHVVIDNDTEHAMTQNLPSATSGRDATYIIPAQSHGVHSIEMYLTANIGGVDRRTPSIRREYIWYDINDEETPVIIASQYNGQTIEASQYSTINIPYQVYKKGASTIDVNAYLDSNAEPFSEVTLQDVNTGTLSYLALDEGEHSITITVDDVSIHVNLVITAIEGVDLAPVTGAAIDFDPTMLTNSSSNRLPSWTYKGTTYSLTASDNFNWSDDISGGGYKEDKDGKCFIIKAGSYVDLNYKMFANNVFNTGAEIKIIFKTDAVRTADAVWFDNTGLYNNKTVGIQLGAHVGWLKTDKAADTSQSTAGSEYPKWESGTSYTVNSIVIYKDVIYKCIKDVADDPSTEDINEFTANPKDASDYWLAMGKIDTEVLATNSYLYLPYSESDKIELDININKYTSGATNNFIMSYEDGVPSKAYSYTYAVGGDGLIHNSGIRIGSPDCDVYLYHLRIYDSSLTTAQILQNFIADGRDIDEKINRYNKNCIYWDSTQEKYFTSPSGTATLDPIKLAERIPDVKILMLDTPVFTVGKKNYIKDSTLRCIHSHGGKIYESRGDADNWFFQGGFHSGQGTTSDNYGQSARNVDFLFESDGQNFPAKPKDIKKSYDPSKNPGYQSSVIVGENATKWDEATQTWVPTSIYDETSGEWIPNSDILTAEELRDWTAHVPDYCDNWKGDHCKVSLTSGSIPNNYFNLKVNVASSENVNNALFQARFNQFLNGIHESPAYKRNNKIKNSMEFVPAILFVRENAVDDQGNPKGHTEFNDCNWHFYALGNIGDSKKTDYTRAYDPDDMNEFTVENSDNNTNNGQFQSGVFEYEGHEAIETDYTAWSNENAYETGAIVVYNGMIYVLTGANQDAGASWNTSAWTAIEYTGWTETDPPYFAPRVNPNPMEYIYGIKPSQWNVQYNGSYLNRKHMTLVTEEFDGDHSFEFRYACKGDYRDGSLINESPGQDDAAQFNLNHDVVLAFYEWLVTATNEQFVAEAEQWFVPEAMEFFYAFTHYYTMMDNRAKNTFWHFAKTGTHHQVSRPVAALLHVYDELINGEYVHTEDVEIDPNKTYYTEYAFDIWAYDMDTAVGIDNNGALVFPYGKEDEDFRVEGEASSGYAFNGAGSIFWRRLKTSFADGIVAVMNDADPECFDSENLIEQFDTFQNCFPEEIWRLDIERKYIRTFTGASVDNSIITGKQNPRFLTSMMQGRKKYQRRQWIRNQGVYFNSKYRLSDITRNENTIEFNIITPTDTSSLAVTPSYNLKLTPYQDMYLNVTIGNGGPTPQIRAKAGVEYTLDLLPYSSGTFAETRLYIYGFNSIAGIGNLAPMYPYSFTLSALKHLKVLDLGTTNNGYRNANFTTLPFNETTQLPLLETLNIQNCNALAGSIQLNTANNLRTIEATGTAITGVILPDYTNIETLHLPASVNAVSLYSARFLKDFKMLTNLGAEDYSNLYTLHVYDSDYSANYKEDPSDPLPIDWISIAIEMLQKESAQTDLSLRKLLSATIEDINTLEPISSAKTTIENAGGSVVLGGTIHVTGDWSTIEKDDYEATWPELNLDVSQGTEQSKHTVIYKYDDYVNDEGVIVHGEEIKRIYVNDGDVAPDIYETGLIDKPTRTQTVSHTYQFGELYNNTYYISYSGWRANGSGASDYYTQAPVIRNDNTIILTHFKTFDRTYPVKWFMNRGDSTAVKTSTAVPVGGGYDLIAPTVAEIHSAGFRTAWVDDVSNGSATYHMFDGWEKLPTNILPQSTDSYYSIYAKWKTETVILDDFFKNDGLVNRTENLSPEQLLVLSGLDETNKTLYTAANIAVNKRITYNMGYTSVKDSSGTELVSLDNPLILNASVDFSKTFENIHPLQSGNDAFTLVIDYRFDDTASYASTYSYAPLVSCYYYNRSQNVRNGFALYYNIKGSTTASGIPYVGFGDMYNTTGQQVAVGNASTLGRRNIVVLRHPAGSSTLYVYSGLNSGNNLPSDVQVTPISWNNYSSNATLSFGKLTGDTIDSNDGTARIVGKGYGTIYYAKYWTEDLGYGECKQLASWPHEPMTYAISSLSSYATQGSRADNSIAPTTSIKLTTMTTSSHGYIYQGRDSSNMYGWDHANNIMRPLYNNRVFNGLPTNLQAILCKSQVQSYVIEQIVDSQVGSSSSKLYDSPSITRDYLYPISLVNIMTSAGSYVQEDSSSVSPFPWYNSSSIEVYTYSQLDNSWSLSSGGSSNYKNLRFPIKAINWSVSGPLRIYSAELSAFSSTTIGASIGENLRVGDIFLDTTTGKAYQYVSTTDVLLGAPVYINEPTVGGGWIVSESYYTRSIRPNPNNARNQFAYVTYNGSVNGDYNVEPAQTGIGINYSLEI